MVMASQPRWEVFVSRLSFYCTLERLRSMFSPFGAVVDARLIMDPKTKRPKGFGFVAYEYEAEAHKAIKGLNGRIIDGRMIFVEPAEKKLDQKGF